MVKIDAHVHLWNKLNGKIKGKNVYSLGNGLAMFGDEIRLMLPPYLTDGSNPAEALIANMDYAGVYGAVVTQEYIDGNQDEYLLQSKIKYPDRLKIFALYEQDKQIELEFFDGLKVPAGRLENLDLTKLIPILKKVSEKKLILSIDLADGMAQIEYMHEIISELPDLKIAIGHFGMVTRPDWEEQIKLARNKNVFIESGGITWLFHEEFYPYPSAVKAIKRAAEICGIDKLMWGSDYPRTMCAITYKMSFDFIEKSGLKYSDKEHFLWLNAQNFYGFKNTHELNYIKNMCE